MTQGAGLRIMAKGHVARLKWHRLRRSLTDPEFGAAVMAQGFGPRWSWTFRCAAMAGLSC